jgi:uncharacterized protein (TIGR02145 family)
MKNIIRILELIILITLFYSCSKEEDKIIKDADDNVYTSIKIGTQEWLVQNLKTTKYTNGDLIETTLPATLDLTYISTPKYQWANYGNESNVAMYGRFYTWYAITDIRKVCPLGWHVSTDDEWTTLTTYLGGVNIAGGKLKATGTSQWRNPNTEATNESGFTGLPGGFRTYLGVFTEANVGGEWWSVTENLTKHNVRVMSSERSSVISVNEDKRNGFAVRCVKDN